VTSPDDDLYAVEPEEFVAARDAVVRSLKAAGDAAGAARVAKLRRPTVAAWALNTVARSHPDAIGDLLDAGARLRAAQEEALRGDAAALRTATAARRTAVAAVGALVAEVLGERAGAQAGAVSATLEAATVDESVAEALRAGRLDRERSAAGAGFGFGDVGDWTPPPPKKPAQQAAPAAKGAKAAAPAGPAKPPEPAKPKRDEKLHAELDAAVADAKARGAELHDAEAEVSRLKKALADATAAVRAARTRANKAELHAETLRQRVWEQGERRR
jgi:hypothetical protein